jgi:MoaA/NifB/PqqE/SkfB family radical SAM enzyme
LVNPSTPLILERLVAEGYAQDIRVYFISNLIILTDKLEDTLSNFKEVVISVSWDHVDPDKFYFIRFPGKYSKFRKNIDKLVASNIEPKVSVTIDIFNIYDIADIFKEFESISRQIQREYTINLQYVEKPEYFSLRYLEPAQKQEIIAISKKFLEDTKDYKLWKENVHAFRQVASLEQILSDTPSDFDRVVKERTRVLRMYDLMRKTDYKSLFPYIKEYV